MITYQWLSYDGATYTPIGGATSQNYDVTGFADVGVACDLSENGITKRTSLYVVPDVPVPVDISLPTISGSPVNGATLTAAHGSWTGSPTSYAYQWQRDGVNVGGATGTTYLLTSADVGHTIRVGVTATNGAGTSLIVYSASTAAVTDNVPTNTSLPTISGPTVEPGTLTATPGAWTGSPTSYAYQWQRDGANVGGATGATYVTGALDLGHQVRIKVTATNAFGASAPAYSLPLTIANLGGLLYPRMPVSSHFGATPGNPGTHVVAAGGSINAALSAASSGDVVYLHGGSYGYYNLSNYHFSASNPVTIMPYPSETVTVTGPTSTGSNGMDLALSSGIRFLGITWACSKGFNGIKLSSSNDVEFDGCVFRDCGSAAPTGAHGLLLNSYAQNPWTPSQRVQLWNCEIYDWHRNPASPNNNHGIYMASTDHCQVVNTVIYNTIDGAGYGIQMGGGSAYAIVANCTIDSISSTATNTAGSGIVVWGSTTEGSSSQVAHNCLIVNTLLTNNKAWGVCASGATPNPNSLVDYCMAHGNPAGQYLPTFGTKVLFIVGSHNLAPVSPAYANAGTHDYHLTGGSPSSVKTGANPAYAPPTDKDGNPRTPTPALGAYTP